MEKIEKKDYILQLVVFIVLLVLLIARVFLGEKECASWIGFLNVLGVFLAFFTLHDELKREYGHSRKFDLITGIFVIIFLVLGIFSVIVGTGILTLNQFASDMVLLVTLLASLPTQLYKLLLGLWIKRED